MSQLAEPCASQPAEMATASLRTVQSLSRDFPSTSLTRLLHIRCPVIQAPMWPLSPPALIAATSNAGGLGSIAAARLTPEQLTAEIAAVRRLTTLPFAVNLFVPKDGGPYTEEQVQHVRHTLATRIHPHVEATDADTLPSPPPPAWSPAAFRQSVERFERQVEAMLAADTPVFSWTFGIPSVAILQQCKQRGVVTLGTANTPADAAALLATRLVDGIIVQGAEAGGHRGTFSTSDAETIQRANIGLFALLPLIRQLDPNIPLIAAGAVMRGSQLAAALLLGADGAQCGTRFLTAAEATLTPAAHRSILLEAGGQLAAGHYRGTLLTRAFTGRAARGLHNEMIEAFDEHTAPHTPLPWEVQSSQVQPYVRAAVKRGDTRLMQLWAGQAYPMCDDKAAADIVEEMVQEAKAVLT